MEKAAPGGAALFACERPGRHQVRSMNGSNFALSSMTLPAVMKRLLPV
jgi:hypothetical protein